MVRTPGRYKEDLNRGAWTAKEDTILTNYIQTHGETGWRSLPKKAGLNRCGKSCRLRWLNYLRPDIKRGNISPDEEELIIRMHRLLGNRWSLIAGRLPGRTDNEIKNYWNTHLSKKLLTISAVNSKSNMPKQNSDCPQPPGNGCVMKESSNSSDGLLFNSGSGSDGTLSSEEMSDQFLQDPLSLFPNFPEDCLATNIELNNEVLLEPSCLEASSQSGSANGSCSNSSNDLTAPDSAQPENSVSSQLNHCKSFPLHCIDFETIHDFSLDSLLQPTGYSLEDICPVEGCDNIVDNSNWFALGAEQGMREICNDTTLQEPDWMKMKLQQGDCVKWSTQMDLNELCSLLDSDEIGNDHLGSSLMKITDTLL